MVLFVARAACRGGGGRVSRSTLSYFYLKAPNFPTLAFRGLPLGFGVVLPPISRAKPHPQPAQGCYLGQGAAC